MTFLLHLQALRALGNLLDFTPKVAALLAARPAVAPLLSCLDPICRQVQLPLPSDFEPNASCMPQVPTR